MEIPRLSEIIVFDNVSPISTIRIIDIINISLRMSIFSLNRLDDFGVLSLLGFHLDVNVNMILT